MIGEFFSELRGVASLVDGVEARLRDREALYVDGPQHHALQQAALRNFKKDVVETKALMKTLQPTVVNLQSFCRLNEISSQLLSLQRQRVEAFKDHLTRYGYEEPPPAKLYKPDVNVDVAGKKNSPTSSAPDAYDAPESRGVKNSAITEEVAMNSAEGDMDVVDADSTSADSSTTLSNRLHPPKPSGLMEFPKSPPCPVLQSTSSTAVDVGHHDLPIATAIASDVADDDDSILAMELPPTPVCPEMTWRPDGEPRNDVDSRPSVSSSDPPSSSLSSSITPPPRTPAVSALAMAHTPTPPILLSAAKKTLDVTKIDFSGLEDGEVFHTGLTPKTPELHSVFSSMSSRPVSTTLSTTQTGYLDTPFDGRATPSSPESQQPFESLKRELKFGQSGSAAEAPKPAADVMKPVSFIEFEQKQQKVDGITRDVLNNAIKSLNSVFRDKEQSKEALVLSQTQVDALFNDESDARLGTKIILMLLKFSRIDCRSANGQSYVSPFSETDDSILDTSNNDD